MSSRVRTSWFTARFPAPYREVTPTRELFSVTRVMAADVEPFGVYTAQESVIDGDAFIAVGSRAWVATLGDDLLRRLTRFRPGLTTDHRCLDAGVASRGIAGHVDVDGPALLRVGLRARYSAARDCGCIVLLWGVVDLVDSPRLTDFVASLELLDDAA